VKDVDKDDGRRIGAELLKDRGTWIKGLKLKHGISPLIDDGEYERWTSQRAFLWRR